MAGSTVLIVGANRGIGLNLARAFIARKWTVFGSVRPQTLAAADPSIQDLQETGARILEIDIEDEGTIVTAAHKYGSGPLDVLINVAGLGPEPFSWQEHTAEILMDKIRLNAVGPFLTTKHFFLNLKQAKDKVINLSSNLASIEMNDGQVLGYRMSKAALNMVTVTMAKDFQRDGDDVFVMAVYPGYVATRMTKGRFKNDMEECIAGIVNVVENASLEKTGTFVNWLGETLPW